MSHPNLLKIVRDYLLAVGPITTIATSGIHLKTFPDTITAPASFLLINRVGEPDAVLFDAEPYGLSTQIKCFGPTDLLADSLFRAVDDALNGLTDGAIGEARICLCDRSAGPVDGTDPNLPVVDGKEWAFVAATYDWVIA